MQGQLALPGGTAFDAYDSREERFGRAQRGKLEDREGDTELKQMRMKKEEERLRQQQGRGRMCMIALGRLVVVGELAVLL